MGLLDTEQGDAGRIGLWVKMLMKDLGCVFQDREKLRCLNVRGMDFREKI